MRAAARQHDQDMQADEETFRDVKKKHESILQAVEERHQTTLRASEEHWNARCSSLASAVHVKEEELNVCTSEIIRLRDSLDDARRKTDREQGEAEAARQALERGQQSSRAELVQLMDRIDELEAQVATKPALMAPDKAAEAFANIDTNNDGLIDRKEWERAQSKVKKGSRRRDSKGRVPAPLRPTSARGTRTRRWWSASLGTVGVLWLRAVRAMAVAHSMRNLSTILDDSRVTAPSSEDIARHVGRDEFLQTMVRRLNATHEAEGMALQAMLRDYAAANRALREENNMLNGACLPHPQTRGTPNLPRPGSSSKAGLPLSQLEPQLAPTSSTEERRPLVQDDLLPSRQSEPQHLQPSARPVLSGDDAKRASAHDQGLPEGASHHPIREDVDPDESLIYF